MENTKKTYNYFYKGVAISKSQFLAANPENWESEVNELGEYSYGSYSAGEREANSYDKETENKKITIGFLNIEYQFKLLCIDDSFKQFIGSLELKYFKTKKQALKYAEKIDVKGLKVLEIDDFKNLKTLASL